MISILPAVSVDDELLAAVTALVPQVSRSAAPLTREMLVWIVEDSSATTLMVARLDGQIVGVLTLAAFPTPTGVRAWIEDVVTDTAARGKGVGTALVSAAVALATELGVRTVDLTSRPERGEANSLYLKLGFEQRTTNVYRRTLDAAT